MALVDPRQIREPCEPMGLKTPRALVEAGPIQTPSPARLGDIAQLPGQFPNTHAIGASLLAAARFRLPVPCVVAWVMTSSLPVLYSTGRRLRGHHNPAAILSYKPGPPQFERTR